MDGNRNHPTNTLLSFELASPPESDSNNKRTKAPASDSTATTDTRSWIKHFPPMPTKRGYPATVTHKRSLVVAGGDTTWLKDYFLTTVEILNTTTLQWSVASSLPMPLRGATAAVCVDRDSKDSTLYLLGGWDRSGKAVHACSLESLLTTAVPSDPEQTLPDLAAVPCSCCWRKVADAPHSHSSCVSLGNKLFTFGGKEVGGGGSEEVNMFSDEANQWRCVGKMLVGRSHPLVTSLADNQQVVIAGGLTKGPHVTNCCEIARLKKSAHLK